VFAVVSVCLVQRKHKRKEFMERKDICWQWRTRRGGGEGAASSRLETFRSNSVFRASTSCSKFWMIKIYIQYSEFRAHSVFQGKGKLLKNPECKKHVQYSEKFQGKRKLVKILIINICSIQWIQGTLFFRARASCSQILRD